MHKGVQLIFLEMIIFKFLKGGHKMFGGIHVYSLNKDARSFSHAKGVPQMFYPVLRERGGRK